MVLESVRPSVLLSTPALAITLAADDQHVAVVSQSVEGSTRQEVVSKRVGPFCQRPIAGQDQWFALIAFPTELFILRGFLLVPNNGRGASGG